MIRKLFGSLSVTVSSGGTGIVAARSRSSTYLRARPLGRCVTVAEAVSHSAAGTFHVCAAAPTSIARAAAPTRRSGSQWFGVALLPPATWPVNFTVSSPACSIFTVCQSTSSSSAMSIGSIVLIPCPTSGFLAMIVTDPSGERRMKALGENSAAGAFGASAASRSAPPKSMMVPSRRPPPASAETRRNWRRSTRASSVMMDSSVPRRAGLTRPGGGGGRSTRRRGRRGRCLVNGFANALVGRAPAEVAVHRRRDLRVGRRGILRQERGGAHDLTRLAVAALRNVDLVPRALHRMRAVGGEPLDRRDLGALQRRDRQLTRAHG